MANRELVFTLSEHLKPVSANVTMSKHHMKLHQMAKRWKEEAYFELRQNRVKKPLIPPVHLYVTYLFKDRNGRDLDNYSGGGSTKWLIDLLKGFAWSGDDTASEVLLDVSVVEGMDTNETIIRVVEAHGQPN